jgi:hypothetical protein
MKRPNQPTREVQLIPLMKICRLCAGFKLVPDFVTNRLKSKKRAQNKDQKRMIEERKDPIFSRVRLLKGLHGH